MVQVNVYATETHLCGELLVSEPLPYSYHIHEEDACFVKTSDVYYRKNTIVKQLINKNTGNEVTREIIKQSNARVLYDESFINKD